MHRLQQKENVISDEEPEFLTSGVKWRRRYLIGKQIFFAGIVVVSAR
jgi:hypothetical protein